MLKYLGLNIKKLELTNSRSGSKNFKTHIKLRKLEEVIKTEGAQVLNSPSILIKDSVKLFFI